MQWEREDWGESKSESKDMFLWNEITPERIVKFAKMWCLTLKSQRKQKKKFSDVNGFTSSLKLYFLTLYNLVLTASFTIRDHSRDQRLWKEVLWKHFPTVCQFKCFLILHSIAIPDPPSLLFLSLSIPSPPLKQSALYSSETRQVY